MEKGGDCAAEQKSTGGTIREEVRDGLFSSTTRGKFMMSLMTERRIRIKNNLGDVIGDDERFHLVVCCRSEEKCVGGEWWGEEEEIKRKRTDRRFSRQKVEKCVCATERKRRGVEVCCPIAKQIKICYQKWPSCGTIDP